MNTESKPFTPETQVIARLLEAAGFRLSRGTYHSDLGDHPLLCIDRPDAIQWRGVSDFRSDAREHEDVLYLAKDAMDAWEERNQS